MAKEINKTHRNNAIWLTTIIIAAFIGTGLWLGLRGGNQARLRSITVSGECLSSVVQDMTAVTIRFVAMDKNPSRSVDLARNAYEVLSKQIREIDDEAIKMNTTRFDSYEKTEWNNNENRSVKIGTETNIELEVSTENRNTIEKIIALAGGAEFTEIQRLRMFTSPKTMKTALDACIKTAVENAREKATTIARADGRRIDKMISAEFNRTVSGASGIIRPMMKSSMYNSASYDAATGIPELFSSDSEISVTVDVEFEVK